MKVSSERFIYFRLKLFMFFMYGTIALFLPFLPLYLQHNGFSPTEIGVLLTIGPIVAIFSNPLWGFFSDRLQNIKLTLLILIAGAFLASQFLYHVKTFYLVFIGMMLYYFFNTAINPINNSQVFQTIENTELRFGSFRLWGSLGYAVIVLAAGPVIESLGIGRLGWVYGTAMLVAFGLGLMLHRPPAKAKKRMQPITFRESAGVLLQGKFALFLLASLFIFIPNAINAQYLSLFVEDLGGTETSIGWSMFVAAILEVPLFLLLDRFSKPNGASMINLLLAATGVFAVRWLLMSFATAPFHIILIQLLHSVSFGFYIYTAAQLVEYLTDRSLRASGQTMYALSKARLPWRSRALLADIFMKRSGRERFF
ncbi:MFS transporter [Paenibacillus alkalitolerans]|uniref:MFS transporter n=1 Tax=Paenibacillus alkalitolerans TaxID=2799335 RepID=UPI0018F4DA52|nr:MFS transporter [Paenibacillus alkalitolerans]